MAEILPSRIELLSDPNSGPQDKPAQKKHGKQAVAEKPVPPHVPEVSAPEEEDKHNLDEMA